MRSSGELVEFLGDDEPADAADDAPAWLVMIVDDDPDVHRSSELALRGASVLDRPLSFLHAYTAGEAVALLAAHPGVAVLLLDVVMETADAGLGLVHTVRRSLDMTSVRIILRTGQPGYAPEIETICHYDINDYKAKSDLTRTKLLTAVIAAIRSYDQLCRLEAGRRGLQRVVDASTALMAAHDVPAFAATLLAQLAAVAGAPASGLVCRGANAEGSGGEVLASAGRHAGDVAAADLAPFVGRAVSTGATCFDLHHIALLVTVRGGPPLVACLESPAPLHGLDPALLDVLAANAAVCAENVALVAELRDHAFTDRLSGLPNRLAFIRRIDSLNAQAALAGQAVALIDIDEFAEANDMFGHAHGDRLLQAIGARLVESLGTRCLVARVAGDVFGVLGDESLVQPEILLPLFDAPFGAAGGGAGDDADLRITASMGLVRLTGYPGSGADLLKDASIAIKRGKSAGHGQAVYFDEGIAADNRRRSRLLADLRRAFHARELYMAFQPQVEVASGRIIGVEALMRWPTPADTMVPPDTFIPVAEQSGLIVDLGEWALHQALGLSERLRASNLPDLRVAVNVSLVQFRHPGFLAMLDRVLAAHPGCAPRLELEITESVALMGSLAIERVLHEVKSRGLAVVIDDFGTGYSSLSYLDRLPVDRLKIDKSFIFRLAGPEPDTRLVEMVIALSHKLGLEVVAEGVETEDQAAIIRALGCDEGQGYLWGRPMTADQLVQSLRRSLEGSSS